MDEFGWINYYNPYEEDLDRHNEGPGFWVSFIGGGLLLYWFTYIVVGFGALWLACAAVEFLLADTKKDDDLHRWLNSVDEVGKEE